MTIFSRFLTALGVPHTDAYSDGQFRDMTFKSLFGLSHLLTDYGVPNEAFTVSDKSELTAIPVPFLAQTRQGIFVIVDDIDRDSGVVTYDSLGVVMRTDVGAFEKAWNGIVLLAYPDSGSKEPDYGSHRLTEVVSALSGYALLAAALAVFVYFFVTRHVYAHVSTVLLAVFDLAGIFFSYLLVQKTLGVHSQTGDSVCKVIEQGGCDSIMEMKVSKLFGVFAWSEVGLGYFGVSLVTLLLFPHLWPAMALCNVCCLPYSFWSVWYQKFRAHHWCTLCLGVQATLWALFFCNLFGGWLRMAWPPRLDFFVLVAVYVCAVLAINRLLACLTGIPRTADH